MLLRSEDERRLYLDDLRVRKPPFVLLTGPSPSADPAREALSGQSLKQIRFAPFINVKSLPEATTDLFLVEL